MSNVTLAFFGTMIPMLGTTLGAAMVFFLKDGMKSWLQKALLGFASGVMIAASVWSLLIPSIEMAQAGGGVAWIPAAVGFLAGMGFLLLLDTFVPHMHMDSDCPEGHACGLGKSKMLVLAVALHNLPEGMAVGVVLAGLISGSAAIPSAAALTLSLGIAIQNFPEGAIISVPLHASGMPKGRSFAFGFLSGVVEPVAALLTICAASAIAPAMPYVLSFAAGAMLYVVVEELIPEMSEGGHSHIGTIFFAIGFAIMMMLDIVLG